MKSILGKCSTVPESWSAVAGIVFVAVHADPPVLAGVLYAVVDLLFADWSWILELKQIFQIQTLIKIQLFQRPEKWKLLSEGGYTLNQIQ